GLGGAVRGTHEPFQRLHGPGRPAGHPTRGARRALRAAPRDARPQAPGHRGPRQPGRGHAERLRPGLLPGSPPRGVLPAGGRTTVDGAAGLSLFALLGSGEWQPWTDEVDRLLLERTTGDGTVLILPTASAPEGDRVFEKWAWLGDVAPDSTSNDPTSAHFWRPGLGLFPKLFFGPHWDALDVYVPGLRASIVAAIPHDCRLLAIDEDTAVVGDGTNWQVVGKGGASILEDGDWTEFPSGTSFTAHLEHHPPRR